MSSPPLPLLLYAEPTWSPSPWRIAIYLAEKQISSEVVKLVPHLDEEASRGYPKIAGKATGKYMGPTVPKLAVPKKSNPSTNQDDYTWLVESAAIMEYLEDLCDANPQFSPVPSLRGGDDLVRRSLVRAELIRSEAVWTNLGVTLMLGSQMYNDVQQIKSTHLPSAHAVAAQTRKTCLDGVNDILGQNVDFEGLAGNVDGAASIADIALFATFQFYRYVHGVDACKGYPNMERFMAAWLKRKTSRAGIPQEGYPPGVEAFRNGFAEEVWPKPVFD